MAAGHQWVLLITSLALGPALFGPMLWSPGEYLMGTGGDGLKNTFTFLWYVVHDHGTWFTGMNYPFGEHPNFPDVQPGLAWIVRGLQHLGLMPAGGAAALGALYWSLALGVAAAPPVLFALLRRAGVNPWFAIVAAVLITLQSPQIDRLAGHFALSYPVVVPGLWLLVVRLSERPTVGRALALVAAGLAASFLTSYYVMCALLLAGGYALLGVLLAQRPNRGRAVRVGLWLLGAVGLIVGIHLSWLALTDPYAAERTKDPFGFFTYVTTFAGVFLPSYDPLLPTWKAIFYHDVPDFEGRLYVGTVPAVVLVLTVWRALAYLLRWPLRRMRPGLIVRPVLPTFLRTGLWVAVLTLLLAMAYPFWWPGFKQIPELLPPLKQLRALGRFGWLFYYIYATYAAVYLWQLARYLRLRGGRPFATSLLVVVSILWGLDALLVMRRFTHLTDDTPLGGEFLDGPTQYLSYLGQAGRYADTFQAIIPLPYFSLGSEKWWANGAGVEYEAFRAAFQTGQPLVATMMSRTSIRQTGALATLFSSPLIARDTAVVRRLNQRPFLLLTRPGAVLPAAQQRLIKIAKPLFANDRVALYELSVAQLVADERAQALADTSRRVALPAAEGGVAVSGLIHPVLRVDYPGKQPGRHDAGAIVQPWPQPEPRLIVYDGPLPGGADTLRYEASVWLDLQTPLALPWMHVKQFDSNGQQLSDNEADLKATFEVQGHWLRGAVLWQRHPNATRMQVYLDGARITADDLLVRPARTQVWGRTAKGVTTLNGYGLDGTP